MVFNKFYLVPTDGRKSFYNKCFVEVMGNTATLYSYDTKIMSYNRSTGEVIKYPAYNYSMTTKRHQKAFIAYYDIKNA